MPVINTVEMDVIVYIVCRERIREEQEMSRNIAGLHCNMLRKTPLLVFQN